MGIFLVVLVAVVVFIAGIIYVKLRYGRLFDEISFDSSFPEELKPFVTKNIRVYHVDRIQDLLKRYEETKSSEANFFSLERFLDEERIRIKIKK